MDDRPDIQCVAVVFTILGLIYKAVKTSTVISKRCVYPLLMLRENGNIFQDLHSNV